MRFATLGIVGLLVGAGACSAATDDSDNGSEAVSTANAMSPVGTAVVRALRMQHPDEIDKTWGLSSDNKFESGFVLQIPGADTWGANDLQIAETCAAED